MSEEEQPVVKTVAQMDWRRLLRLFLLIMVLPTITAILLDVWFGVLPWLTLVAIVICFPTATFLVMRTAIREMERVIDEVAPLPLSEAETGPETGVEMSTTPEAETL